MLRRMISWENMKPVPPTWQLLPSHMREAETKRDSRMNHNAEPDDAIVGQVHGIAVAGEDFETGLEALVHFLDVVLVEFVVGIEHEKGVIRVGCARLVHLVEQIGQRVAFADLLLVESFDDVASHVSGHFGGVVGAVVGHQPDVDELARIGLRMQAVDEVADDVRFVSRGNQHRVPFVHRRFGELDRLGEQRDDDADRLVEHAGAAQNHQHDIKYAQQYH